jgi:hypothetical protein
MLDWKDWQLAVDSGYRETLRVLEQQARGAHSPADGADLTVAG